MDLCATVGTCHIAILQLATVDKRNKSVSVNFVCASYSNVAIECLGLKAMTTWQSNNGAARTMTSLAFSADWSRLVGAGHRNTMAAFLQLELILSAGWEAARQAA